MAPVDHTKTKQLILDFSRRSIRTDDIGLAKQHAKKEDISHPMKHQQTLDLYWLAIWGLIQS